jgi:hypothetical protein
VKSPQRDIDQSHTETAAKVPPASLDRVVDSTQGFTLGTLKMFPRHVLQAQFQALRFSLKAAFAHSPLAAQSQRCGKKFFRCHPFYSSPPPPKTQIPLCLPTNFRKAFAVDRP